MANLARIDEVDSKIEANITFITSTTTNSDSEEAAEPVIVKSCSEGTKALPQQTRFAIAETLSRCLPVSNTPFGRVLTTIIIITIIVLFELVLTSDYSTLKALTLSIISTLARNDTATEATAAAAAAATSGGEQ
jgi:hypothetical protein